MAKNIDDYWLLLPERDTELQIFIENYSSGRVCPSNLKKKSFDFLCRCLQRDRVTTCKLLRLLPSSVADEIYHSVLFDLVKGTDIDDKCNQFLSILLNGQFSADLITRFELQLFPEWINVLTTNKDIDQPFKLGLSFVDDDTFRDRFLCVNDRLCVVAADDLISRRRLFLLTIVERQHFLEKLIHSDEAVRTNLSNDVLRRTLCLIHLLRNADLPITEHQQLVNEITQFAISCTNNRLTRNLFNEVQRLLTVNKLFASHIPNIQLISYGSTFSVIDILYEHVDLSNIDSQSVLSTLEENREYNQRFNLCDNETTNQKLTELELYRQFLVIKLLLEVIMDNQQATTMSESSAMKLSQVKTLINCIESVEQLTAILQVSFSLIFIRWDNVIENGDPLESDRSENESGSESIASSRKNSSRSDKTVFICSAVVLDSILNLLKSVAVQAMDSNALTDDSAEKCRLQQLSNIINDAHWRMTLFNSTATVTEGSRSASFTGDDVRKYFGRHRSHVRENLNGSSDDNDSNSQRMTSAYRRKPRKRNSLRKSNDDKFLATANSTEQEQRSDALNRSLSGSERRCPVSRLFGSPEHLATFCLNMGKFGATKEIVEANSLDDTCPAKELQFMESYNATKRKLRSIFGKYNSEPNGSTVERLKHAATVGFEASQAQSIITSFAEANEFHVSEETRNLSQKLHHQHPFLETFSGSALQASIAVDLLISLTNSYEMCFHIFNMLTKLWVDTRWLEEDSVMFGYLKFTKNICECLQLYKSIGDDNFGVRQLMCNESYVLLPVELKAKLESERVMKSFQCLTSNDIDSVAKWKALLKPVESIRGDVNYFYRCYNFVVNFMELLRMHSTNGHATPLDAMKSNVTAVIGDIVFGVNDKAPGDIAEIVEHLNVNFVYVLCVNVMPVIPSCEPSDSAVTDSLIENLRNDNLFAGRSINKSLHRLNAEVLNFVRKSNYLVAHLLQEYDCTVNGTATYEQKYLKNFMALDEVIAVAMMHENNLLLSALNYDTFDVGKLEKFLSNGGSNGDASRIVQNCSDRSLRLKGDRLKSLQDTLIAKLLHASNGSNTNCDLIERLNDVNVKSKHLLEHIESIECSDMVKRLIQSVLLHKNISALEESLKVRLLDWLHNIQVYEAVADRMSCGNWVATRELSIHSTESILKSLMDVGEFDLCLAWLKLHPLAESPTKFPVFSAIFSKIILATTSLNGMMFKVVETLPLNVALQFYDSLLTELRSLELLEYVSNFLITHSLQPFTYHRYRISLKIFGQMNEAEQDTNWVLFNTPLMIIEQYLMNSRHEAMSTLLSSIKPILSQEPCKYCLARNSSYDAKSSSDPDFRISSTENDFGHQEHTLSIHCIDSLLKMYASKALDFRVSETHSHSSNDMFTHSMASLDSLCGSFVMPKVAPDRSEWVKDQDASHCMCCRRSAFTMLCRRHHCRRCGRVVCHVCSKKRIEIRELYFDVQVRSCDDCYKQLQNVDEKKSSNHPSSTTTTAATVVGKDRDDVVAVWQFSGNKKHDNLLREEFCFEYAPSVSLCLSILQFYSSDTDCVNFLLHHCQKFESLLRPIQAGYPNPEIDYALVTRMMHCLALAAKVRGGPPECDTIRDHGEIIQSIVHHGCESLMPLEPPNSSSFRTLRDSLVLAEKWSLALELSLKCGFPTTGVLASNAIASLRAGCFDTAREKFSHCLTKAGTDDDTFRLTSLILQESTDDLSEWNDSPKIKRPTKSPPLLDEILSILELTCRSHQPEVIARASVIKDSNTSLSSNLSKKREKIPLHEPALNVMHTLSSLRNVTRGIYDGSRNRRAATVNKKVDAESTNGRKPIRSSRFYDECLYYLTRYGSHNSILAFLIKNEQVATALKYFLYEHVDADSFINLIFLPFLRAGKVDTIISLLMAMDDTLLMWKDVIIKTCCYLEHKGLLNSLYHLQVLLKDPVRASMTCVKFYSMNCTTYTELQNNSFHLTGAQKHLQTELELCQWEEIPSVPTADDQKSILMKMDSRTLNSHINTIWRQIEVTKFLSQCEQSGCDTVALLTKISAECSKIPTLFGTLQEKFQLAVLTIIAGSNINAGFGLAFRIIQDFNLSPIKVYGITAKYLSGHSRLSDVETLIENIKSDSDSCNAALCDEIISLAVQTAVASFPLNAPIKQLIGQTIESLLRHVTDVGIKISCHIAGGQLKSAYLLAVQYDRYNDVRKVLRKAEQTNQQHIKKLCEKKLNAH